MFANVHTDSALFMKRTDQKAEISGFLLVLQIINKKSIIYGAIGLSEDIKICSQFLFQSSLVMRVCSKRGPVINHQNRELLLTFYEKGER